MFVDSAVVTFIAGKGGDGCVSFRREKFVPRGGPNGGDGGNGGDIILRSHTQCFSLVDFKFQNFIRAEKGANGSGSLKTGKSGKNRILDVPPGTVIKTYPDEKIIFDFSDEGMEFMIVKGGKGGLGNSHFKSSIQQTPQHAQKGKKGESIKVVMELKLIAFAGLVGFPNAGKSTLISKISGAKPKIADYPFTTLTPHLGVVYQDYASLVVADIPGIIAGAHKGEGMGLNFLKHIERNKVLVFLIDASPYAEKNPLDTFRILKKELKSYHINLTRKKYIVVANKIDLIDENSDDQKELNLQPLKNLCQKDNIPFLEISAVKDINLDLLKNQLFKLYNES